MTITQLQQFQLDIFFNIIISTSRKDEVFSKVPAVWMKTLPGLYLVGYSFTISNASLNELRSFAGALATR